VTVVPAAPSPVEATLAAATRSSSWHLEAEVPLTFDAHHPQGLTRHGGLWWLTTVDIGRERGHLLAFDDAGSLVHDVAVGSGPRFHPGGFDARGDTLTVAVAEYRPASSTIVVAVDARTLEVTERFAVDDHLGAVAVLDDASLVGFTWGSREFLWFDPDGAPTGRAPNPSHFVDHQDVQVLPGGALLCSGVAGLAVPGGGVQLGGVAVVDTASGAIRVELPVTTSTPAGRVITFNPLHARVDDGALVVTVLPDDGTAGLFTYRLG
jgi:hypothetical protein